jgi:hypothetical protein
MKKIMNITSEHAVAYGFLDLTTFSFGRKIGYILLQCPTPNFAEIRLGNNLGERLDTCRRESSSSGLSDSSSNSSPEQSLGSSSCRSSSTCLVRLGAISLGNRRGEAGETGAGRQGRPPDWRQEARETAGVARGEAGETDGLKPKIERAYDFTSLEHSILPSTYDFTNPKLTFYLAKTCDYTNTDFTSLDNRFYLVAYRIGMY